MVKTLNISVPDEVLRNEPVYDYGALESLEEFKPLADSANLIILVNPANPAEWYIAFGKTMLESIIFDAKIMRPTTTKGGVVAPLLLAVNMGTDEMAHAIAAVKVTKGYHDYPLDAE